MQQITNLTDALKGMVNISRELGTLTGNDDQKIPAFWLRTTDEFSAAITNKNIHCYNNMNDVSNKQYENKVTPQELRFPGIKSKILEIYDAEEEELCKEFMTLIDGKMKVNSDWIKINREDEDDEFGKEDVKLIQSIRENGGYRITIKSFTFEDRKKGKVDVELPLSNIFRACQWVDKKKICLNPRYPFLFFFYMMNLFKFSVPSDRISPNIQNIIDDLWDRRESLLEKPKFKLNPPSNSGISNLINSHKDSFNSISNQINLGLDTLLNDDDQIDKLAFECDRMANMFAPGSDDSKKDFAQIISGLMNADEDKIRSTMNNFGFSENNIKAIVDNVSGSISNEELKSSIPTNDLDSFLSQINDK